MADINYIELGQQVIASDQPVTTTTVSTHYAHETVDTTARELIPPRKSRAYLPGSPAQHGNNNQGQHGYYSSAFQRTSLKRNNRHNELNDAVAHVTSFNQLPELLRDPHNVEIFREIVVYYFNICDQQTRIQIIDEADNYANADLRSRYYIPKPDCIVEYIRENKNCLYCEALLALAKRLGLRWEYIFGCFPPPAKSKRDPNAPLRRESDESPKHERDIVVSVPPRLIVDGQVFTLTHRDCQQDMRGMTEQMLCSYTAKYGKGFVLMASRVKEEGKFVLKIGFTAPKAQFFPRKMIDCNRTSTIVLPLDMEASLLLRRFGKQQRLLEGSNIIISGFYDGENALDALPFKELGGCSVVLIPKAGYKGLLEADEYAKACLQAGASSVRVYLGAVVTDSSHIPDMEGLHASWEKAHWNNVIDLSAGLILENMLMHICNKALSLADVHHWKTEMGLKVAESSTAVDHSNVYRMRSLADISDTPAQHMANISVSTFFQSVYTTFIWGFSNIGKSWVAVELVLALVTRTRAFFLPADPPESPRRKVCYIDAELGGVDFKRRCAQLLASRNSSMSEIKDRVWIISALEDNVDLLIPAWRTWFIEQISSGGFTDVFLDNINAFLPEAPKGNVRVLFDFIREIKKIGIAVTLLHHADKDAKNYTGTGKLGDLTQNQFRLDGRKQIREGGGCSPALEAALDEDGPVVRLEVIECKCAPHFEGRSATYAMSTGETWQYIEDELENCTPPLGEHEPVLDVKEVDNEVSASVHAMAAALAPDEQKVLKYVQQADCKRKEVEVALNLKTRTASNILTKLVGLGLIEMRGFKQGAYYHAS